jgi:hypothetical protein
LGLAAVVGAGSIQPRGTLAGAEEEATGCSWPLAVERAITSGVRHASSMMAISRPVLSVERWRGTLWAGALERRIAGASLGQGPVE